MKRHYYKCVSLINRITHLLVNVQKEFIIYNEDILKYIVANENQFQNENRMYVEYKGVIYLFNVREMYSIVGNTTRFIMK